MLFNSIEFLFFLPLVFVLYWFVFNKKLSYQNGLILLASYFFYGWWSWKFMGLLMLSTALDFLYGFGVSSTNKRKAKLFLWLSIINNLGILCVFKYYNFFVIQLMEGLHLIGIQSQLSLLQLALPIGISFYTFHGMSYVFDIYNGKQKPVKNFVDYAVFVGFFPLLVAGPIERASHLLPQVQKRRFFNYIQAVEGGRLILWGLVKKIIIADSLALFVDQTFNDFNNQSTLALIAGAIAFSFQIYGDFSGYSDIALGVAKLFGFELLSNFRFPYFSRDIAEFWRRWHISLSSWFKDYLYIPLGGSKNGKLIAIRNTFIIFLVSGFWHGASWNFILWGGIHAIGFLPLLLLNKNRKNISEIVAHTRPLPNLKELFQMISTFAFVTFAWVFFRSDNLYTSLGFLKQISLGLIGRRGHITAISENWMAIIYIIPLLIGDWHFRKDERKLNISISNQKIRMIIYILIVFYTFMRLITANSSSFIYFQF